MPISTFDQRFNKSNDNKKKRWRIHVWNPGRHSESFRGTREEAQYKLAEMKDNWGCSAGKIEGW